LRIDDDGRGFDVERATARQGQATLGLQIMRERVLALSGELRMTSVPGRGTRVEVSVPS
jgi:signal transduction histidine kinase